MPSGDSESDGNNECARGKKKKKKWIPDIRQKIFQKKPRQHVYFSNWIVVSTIVFMAQKYWGCSFGFAPQKHIFKKAIHLEGFTEHVFAFFAPQQVDDHLFAVKPPQCSEMSGSNKQKHCESNITKYIHLTWKSFAERDYFRISKGRIVCGESERVFNTTCEFTLLCLYNIVDWLISSQCFRKLCKATASSKQKLQVIRIQRQLWAGRSFPQPLQSTCSCEHPAISMFSFKNPENFSPSWPGHRHSITFAHKGVAEKPAKNH